jgi:hypothetical protein
MSRSVLDTTALVTGFAIMGAEMGAGRLMAPFYGTSTLIWSMLIGGVMSSLAMGYPWRLPSPRPWRPAPGSPVLTDLCAPVELLTDRIVLAELWRSLAGG